MRLFCLDGRRIGRHESRQGFGEHIVRFELWTGCLQVVLLFVVVGCVGTCCFVGFTVVMIVTVVGVLLMMEDVVVMVVVTLQ